MAIPAKPPAAPVFEHLVFPAGFGFVAGFVDLFGFLAWDGLLAAHVTGNLIFLAYEIARGHYALVMKLAALPVFAVSVAAAAWLLAQDFPADNATAGLPPAEKIVANYVSAVAVEDGAIHITFGNRVNRSVSGKVLSLRPAVVKDAPIVPVAWVCGYAEAPDKMTINGRNLTDIPAQLLPRECRALKQ